MRPVIVTSFVDLTSAPADVWPLITNTDRINRLTGGKPVSYRPIEDDVQNGARYIAETNVAGFNVTYEEHPFEFTHGRSYRVLRTMRSGPVKSYTMSMSLKRTGKDETGTRVTFNLELVPRSWVLRPVAWMNARNTLEKMTELARGIDGYLVNHQENPFDKPVSPTDERYLANGERELVKSGVAPALASRICQFIRDAADADVMRIRPYEIADAWSEDRRMVLRALLRSVPAGLVELRWSLVCPSCRTASSQVTALDEISMTGHCQLCDISYDLDLDRAVEATFVVHPSVRAVTDQLFCIGGPARTPHVLVQSSVEPNESKPLDAPEELGRYRLFARGGALASIEIEADAPKEVEATITDDAIKPADMHVAPGGIVRVKNETKEPRHVKIERLGYASVAATAHEVSTLGEFRQLFSSDLLKRGTPLKVARVAILFSDLTGSTALYTKVGDASAFRLVDDHFDLLREVIEEEQGAIVKTMGDAIMASFTDARRCGAAAVKVLERFEAFRVKRENGDLVGIKVGMFAGPCYVVTANGALDYFGQTVNVASRVQHLADSGEIVLEESQLDALDEDMRARLVRGERFEARVKGVDQPLALIRVRLAT